MADLLTATQVAQLADIHPKHVREWADLRHIRYTQDPGQRGYRYPAGPVHDVIRRQMPGPLRLARFIRNPLNRQGAP